MEQSVLQGNEDQEFVFLAIQLFNESPDAIIVVDDTGTIKYLNDQAELLFGYHRSELHGQPVHVLVPDALRTAHTQHVQRFTEDPRRRAMGSGMELKAKRKNGGEMDVLINLSPVSTPNGMRVIATIRRKNTV
jgi:PAS domain S-box-containing protein